MLLNHNLTGNECFWKLVVLSRNHSFFRIFRETDSTYPCLIDGADTAPGIRTEIGTAVNKYFVSRNDLSYRSFYAKS